MLRGQELHEEHSLDSAFYSTQKSSRCLSTISQQYSFYFLSQNEHFLLGFEKKG